MSSFTAPLILEALPYEHSGRGVFAVHEAFTYDIGHLGSGHSVTVPVGFRTDLCSVPAFARPFIPLAGRLAKPALVHDYLLYCGEDHLAHDVFDEALAVAGVGPVLRFLVVSSCRLFWRTKGWWCRLRGKPLTTDYLG